MGNRYFTPLWLREVCVCKTDGTIYHKMAINIKKKIWYDCQWDK